MNKQTAAEWLSNQAYELFEQYSEGKFDRIALNKLMLEATVKAKAMEKEQMDKVAEDWWNEGASYIHDGRRKYESFQHYYLEIYGGEDKS
jgi:hypothetical protein